MAYIAKPVFITGGTGYIGKRLINMLLTRGFEVTALVRQQSVNKLPAGCKAIIADPFDHHSYVRSIPPQSIFIHLLGVSHPGPKKAEQFYSVDLASVKQSVKAAVQANVFHFVYISVAQYPTKIMAAYQDARLQGENAIIASGLKATILRPWYIVGPGHYWPLFFLPVFKLLEIIPATSRKAKLLGLVYLKQMLLTLINIFDGQPPADTRIIEIRDIKNATGEL